METKSYTTIDRVAAGWGSGPWDGEPDKMQWPDPETGMPCLAVRHTHSGHWCGYVGVPPGHPLHGADYDEVTFESEELTFADSCQPSKTEDRGVCHIPSPGEPDHVWWFGFDFAHANDVTPLDHSRYPFDPSWGATYKTLDHVRNSCAKLAAELASMQPCA